MCIHTSTHIQASMHTCTQVHTMQPYIHTHLYASICTHTCTHIQLHIPITCNTQLTCTYSSTKMQRMQILTHVHICTCPFLGLYTSRVLSVLCPTSPTPCLLHSPMSSLQPSMSTSLNKSSGPLKTFVFVMAEPSHAQYSGNSLYCAPCRAQLDSVNWMVHTWAY